MWGHQLRHTACAYTSEYRRVPTTSEKRACREVITGPFFPKSIFRGSGDVLAGLSPAVAVSEAFSVCSHDLGFLIRLTATFVRAIARGSQGSVSTRRTAHGLCLLQRCECEGLAGVRFRPGGRL